jgi:hypothetical protein
MILEVSSDLGSVNEDGHGSLLQLRARADARDFKDLLIPFL